MTAEIESLTIGPGSEVTLYFTLSLTDGTIADATEKDQPMHFFMGDGTFIEGLELVLYGLKVGDQQCLSIGPRDAFGLSDEESVHEIPRDDFPPEVELDEGLIMGFSTPSGEEIPGTIKKVGKEMVEVDFNHPLAGHEVIFDVEILEIKPGQSINGSHVVISNSTDLDS